MTGKPDKPHRIRVRTLDRKPRDQGAINKLKSNQLGMPHLDIVSSSVANELIVCASKEAHIEQVRAKLGGAGLEEVPGGDTSLAASAALRSTNTQHPRQGGFQQRGGPQQRGGQPQRVGCQQGRPAPVPTNAQPLPGKPYGFVALPKELTSASPIWHDGNSSAGRLSGEIRFELETLTPLLVGWERGQVGDAKSDWPLPTTLDGIGQLTANKSVLCPLRAPWGRRPVIIPGDSLKGLLRHELGALLGAPMERVAERSYSYRPNLKYPDTPQGRFLEPRIARVRTKTTIDIGGRAWPVPEQVDVLSMATRDQQAYFPRRERGSRELVRPTREAEPYRGGLGGGKALPDAVRSDDARRKLIHTHIDVQQLGVEHASVRPSSVVVDQYAATLKHLLDTNDGHFSARHPNIGTDQQKQRLGREAVEKGAARAFQPGDLVWVEWDADKKCIVSLGWHYYYRWAYTDSVRKNGGKLERHGLFPLDVERAQDDDDAPKGLSPVRRLFGYTGDNDGSAGIGKDDHAQLMGRVSINAGLEVVGEDETDEQRFLPQTFLKELGMPRPSAVEHYLQPSHHQRARPSDKATLVTYGDAAGYDEPGELAGRKFYLDRKDAYPPHATKDGKPPWEDENRLSERSTLALEASRPGRRFRFTVRFRDLDASELKAIVVALCPHQFKDALGGTHAEGYCSKLGYARPLGWGSVRIDVKALLLLDDVDGTPTLKPETDLDTWATNHQKTSAQDAWLDVHCRKHRDATDYPRKDGQIYTFHTTLRAEHSRNRRYRNGGAR